MGASETKEGAMQPRNEGTIYRSQCEKYCCITRYYRISQSTRRDQWDSFTMGSLNAHNLLRQNHGVPRLTLNMRLCKMAYSQAKYLTDNEIFEHSEKYERRHIDGYCGENMAEMVIWHDEHRRPRGEDITLAWYDEGKQYDFDKFEFDPDCSQFTQIIWASTRTFGIAYAEYEPSDANGYVKTVVVANYYPGGNVEKEYEKNINRPIFAKQSSKVQKKIEQYQSRKLSRLKAEYTERNQIAIPAGNLNHWYFKT